MGFSIAHGNLCVSLGSATNAKRSICSYLHIHNLPPIDIRTGLLKTIVEIPVHNRMVIRTLKNKRDIMSGEEVPEESITLSGVPHEEVVCPFSEGRWKLAGDALVLFMLFVTPILFLIAIIITRLT
jgi:hypothetical protein